MQIYMHFVRLSKAISFYRISWWPRFKLIIYWCFTICFAEGLQTWLEKLKSDLLPVEPWLKKWQQRVISLLKPQIKLKFSHQNGFKMARQFGRVQATGSYIIGGRSGRSFRGVYKQLSGTTMRVASRRLDGHTFQLNRTPSLSSFCCINSWYVAILCLSETKKYNHTEDPYTILKNKTLLSGFISPTFIFTLLLAIFIHLYYNYRFHMG